MSESDDRRNRTPGGVSRHTQTPRSPVTGRYRPCSLRRPQSLFISQTLDAVSVYGTYTGTWRTRYNQVRKVCTQEANALAALAVLAALAALAAPWQDSSRNALSSLSHGRGRRGRRRVRRWP